jgi:hypothetical protein
MFRRNAVNAFINAFFIVFFGILQVADGVVTFLGLRAETVDEVNPVLNIFVGLIGLGYSITLIKLAGLAFIAFLFFDRHKMKSRWITTSLGMAVAFYSWVVSSNVFLVVGV